MLSTKGLCCDVCEEVLSGEYIHWPARTVNCPVWGWVEGHEACLDAYVAKQKDWELGEKERMQA